MSETEAPSSGANFELEASLPEPGAPRASSPDGAGVAPARRTSLDRVIDLPVQLSVEARTAEARAAAEGQPGLHGHQQAFTCY